MRLPPKRGSIQHAAGRLTRMGRDALPIVALGVIWAAWGFTAGAAAAAEEATPASDGPVTVFVEAESFQHLGGWVVDQQFMDQMGSAMLMAHGLGVPVEDAVTTLSLPCAGVFGCARATGARRGTRRSRRDAFSCSSMAGRCP